MTTAEQPADATRDYGSPATWGDIERVRLSLEQQMARMETRLTRLILASIAGAVAVLGLLITIIQALA